MFVRAMVAFGSRKVMRCLLAARARRRSIRDAITARRSLSSGASAFIASTASGV
jgi:hypothetical protein